MLELSRPRTSPVHRQTQKSHGGASEAHDCCRRRWPRDSLAYISAKPSRGRRLNASSPALRRLSPSSLFAITLPTLIRRGSQALAGAFKRASRLPRALSERLRSRGSATRLGPGQPPASCQPAPPPAPSALRPRRFGATRNIEWRVFGETGQELRASAPWPEGRLAATLSTDFSLNRH